MSLSHGQKKARSSRKLSEPNCGLQPEAIRSDQKFGALIVAHSQVRLETAGKNAIGFVWQLLAQLSLQQLPLRVLRACSRWQAV